MSGEDPALAVPMTPVETTDMINKAYAPHLGANRFPVAWG
jgi:hypothetical protein